MATTAAAAEKRKPDLKVVILGAASIGKTTLVHRYIERQFQESITTLGASFSFETLEEFQHSNMGEEKFRGLSNFYCRGAGAAILAFDLTDEDSFHSLRELASYAALLSEVLRKAVFVPLLVSAQDECYCVVVGTKKDLIPSLGRSVNEEDGIRLAEEVNKTHPSQAPYFETSSLTGENIDEVFEYLFNWCTPKMAAGRPQDNITVDKEKKGGKGSCAC